MEPDQGSETAHIPPSRGQAIEEPDDLYKVRVAAHECAAALYRYLRYAMKLAEAGEDAEFEQFKGMLLDGPEKTGAEYEKDIFETPLLRLEFIVRSLVAHVTEIMGAHGVFQDLLEPVQDELADVYPGLQNISGAECRSHAKALESLAFHVVRFTFDATRRFARDAEIDPKLADDDEIPFTASNWFPTLEFVVASFPSLDLEDHVHEAIDQEILDAWKHRLASAEQSDKDNGGLWSEPDSPKVWATRFNCSWDTLKKRIADGSIRAKKLSDRSYRIHIDDLPAEKPSPHKSV